jgi:hypothetical protein
MFLSENYLFITKKKMKMQFPLIDGPWKVREDKDSFTTGYTVEAADGYAVANTMYFASDPHDAEKHKKYDKAHAYAISAIPEMEHTIRSFIAGMDNTEPESYPGHHEDYLRQVVLPRAIEALKKAKILL